MILTSECDTKIEILSFSNKVKVGSQIRIGNLHNYFERLDNTGRNILSPTRIILKDSLIKR